MPFSEYLKAIILGVVQGIAEFLPVSSSGHLVIADELIRQFSNSQVQAGENFEMTVALHVGTLFSILVVYRNDLQLLLTRRKLTLAIIVATLPLVVFGLCLMLNKDIKSALDSLFSSPLVAGCGLLTTALVLLAGRRLERVDQLPLEEVTPGCAFLIGMFQVIAIVPGISRAGSTIAGGLVGGLRREASTSFSFFIAIPAICGAAALSVKEIWQGNGSGTPPTVLLLGAAVAFAVGVLSLRWLIRIVSQQRLHWFAWYCGIVGTATVLWRLIAGSA